VRYLDLAQGIFARCKFEVSIFLYISSDIRVFTVLWARVQLTVQAFTAPNRQSEVFERDSSLCVINLKSWMQGNKVSLGFFKV
jgi:hypothetical protein